jgi:hypothetical protein
MALLRKFMCRIFGLCTTDYNKKEDPLYKRYQRIDERVDDLTWRPRDILDIR